MLLKANHTSKYSAQNIPFSVQMCCYKAWECYRFHQSPVGRWVGGLVGWGNRTEKITCITTTQKIFVPQMFPIHYCWGISLTHKHGVHMQMQGKIAYHFLLEHGPHGREEHIKESVALRCGECVREREKRRTWLMGRDWVSDYQANCISVPVWRCLMAAGCISHPEHPPPLSN